MDNLCVFCGSNSGFDDVYAKDAVLLARELAKREIGLVYGGGNVGLMGLIAATVLEEGGSVTGIIPEAIHKKVPLMEGAETIVVDDMHSRKQMMHDRSDGFISLPGGIGTFEELLEAFTWSQLGFHQKPVAVLNTKSYYSSLILQLNHSVDQGFMKEAHKRTLIVEEDPFSLLDRMAAYTPLMEEKWI
jgi:uncharacterized protein (TIGR00730 family)